jgi:hypothetical protein
MNIADKLKKISDKIINKQRNQEEKEVLKVGMITTK